MSNEIDDWLASFRDLNPEAMQDDDTESKKSYKLDLFGSVLPAMDRQDKFYFRKLLPEQQDEIEPWILMRWLTSADSDKDQPHYLLSVNDFVNSNFSVLGANKRLGRSGHKELQWMLLTLCGTGRSPRRKFIKPPKGAIKNKLEEAILEHFPLLKDDELELLLTINSREELVEFFEENGYDDKAIKELLKADAKGK